MFSRTTTPNSTFMPTIQCGCFIIRTMNKTNSALNTSDIKLMYTKYYIRTVIVNGGEFFKVSMLVQNRLRGCHVHNDFSTTCKVLSLPLFPFVRGEVLPATSSRHSSSLLTFDINSCAVLYTTTDIILTPCIIKDNKTQICF